MRMPIAPRRVRGAAAGSAVLLAVLTGAVLAGCSSGSSSPGSTASTSSPGSSNSPGSTAGTATANGAAMPTVTLAIGSDTALPTLPLQIAIGDHLFARYGVNVNVEVTGSGSKAVDALLAGDADISADFYDHVLELSALGKQLESFVELTDMPGYALVVTGKDSAQIHSVADLAGKTVGVSAPGSATAFFVSYLLGKDGLSPSAAHLTGIGIGPSAVAAVEHGTVDAAVLYDPDLSEVLAHDSSVRVLADARSPSHAMSLYGAPTYPSMTIFSTSSWVSAHPALARSVAEAIAAADQYLHQASASAIMSHLASDAIGPDKAFYQSVLAQTIPYISPSGSLDKSALQTVLAVQSIANPAVKAAKINLASTYTDQFVPNG